MQFRKWRPCAPEPDDAGREMEKMGRGLARDKNAADLEEPIGLPQPLLMLHKVLENTAHDEGRIGFPKQRVDLPLLNGQAETATMRRHGLGGFDAFIPESAFNQKLGKSTPTRAHFRHVVTDLVVHESPKDGFMMTSGLLPGSGWVGIDMLGRGVDFRIRAFELFTGRKRDKLDRATGGTAMIFVFAAPPVEARNAATRHTRSLRNPQHEIDGLPAQVMNSAEV